MMRPSRRRAALLWPAATIPVIRLAGRFPLQDRSYATRYLGPAHALHLHGYDGDIRIGDEQFALRPGDLTISPAGLPSLYDLRAAGHHWCVHFLPAAGAEGAALVPMPFHLRLGAAASYAQERLIQISRRHARAVLDAPPDPLAAASAAVALQDLLLWCATRSQTDRPSRGAEMAAVVEQVAAIIETRFAERLSVPRIAREVGRSQNYVARHFRERFGMTIPHYALLRRIGHARYLLESTDLPISRIAARVGLPDPQYFNKQVRRLLGDSPTVIRSSARLPGARAILAGPSADIRSTRPGAG